MLKEILDIINESPFYEPGNWDDVEEVGYFEKDIRYDLFKKDKNLLDEVFNKKLKRNIVWLYKNKVYIGYTYKDPDDVERFDQIGYVKLKRNKEIEKLKKEYKPLYEVSEIFIEDEYRGYGIGYYTYLLLLIKLKINLMSDEIQYDAPKYIYSKLSNKSKICADIINIKTKEILKENYCIYYNPRDKFDFDKLIWDMKDYNSMNIRIILYT